MFRKAIVFYEEEFLDLIPELVEEVIEVVKKVYPFQEYLLEEATKYGLKKIEECLDEIIVSENVDMFVVFIADRGKDFYSSKSLVRYFIDDFENVLKERLRKEGYKQGGGNS